MRSLLIVLAVALALALGALQFLSSLALRDAARPGSWVGLVPGASAARVDELDARWPLPATLRLVLARQALAHGNVAAATQQVALLPASRDRAGLEGELAERRGDTGGAVRAFLDAGDVADLERQIGEIERSGDLAAALRLQNALIDRLRADPTQAASLPDADYQLGLLEESVSYTLRGAAARTVEIRALAAYEAAVTVAPFAQRYLVAAANQELNVGDLNRAQSYFLRAREADPTSVDAVTGLGSLAHRRGRDDEARAYLAQARHMNPSAPAVQRLAHDLGS
jgi:tetratricopeptide (TPR) repeat protein